MNLRGIRVLRITAQTLLSWVMFIAATSCTLDPIYTSRDLARLPCESGDKRFFYPIEFDTEGQSIYPDQLEEVRRSSAGDRDVIIFVHGWDKTSGTAERDYQDFLCRLYWSGIQSKTLNSERVMLIGVFWPSTILRNYEDFSLIKPFSFYAIRDRADELALNGIRGKLLPAILDNAQSAIGLRLHIVGHSFGGRLLIKALTDYFNTSEKLVLLHAISAVNVVLLLPAVEPDVTTKTSDALFRKVEGLDEREARYKTDHLKIFIVSSKRDWANRFLFRMSQLFSLHLPECSIGACGEDTFPTVHIDESVQFDHYTSSEKRVWNIEARDLVSSHGDIYKGRIADLIWKLIRELR